MKRQSKRLSAREKYKAENYSLMEYIFLQMISSESPGSVSATHVHTLSLRWGKMFAGVFFMAFSFALSIIFRHSSVNLQETDLGHQDLALRQLLSRL